MNEQNSREEKVKIIFATHPDIEKFFMTADDQAFTDKQDADNHTQALADKTVQPYFRLVAEKIAELKEKLAAMKSASEGEEKSEDGKPEGQEDETSESKTSEGGEPAKEPSEKEVLQARYLKLYGKKPNHLTGVEKLKEAIEKKEADSNQNQ